MGVSSRLFGSRDKPGEYQGRHFTTYLDEIKKLKRQGKDEELEKLLWGLVRATEADAKARNNVAAPAYYEELAILYRKRKDYVSEVSVLERYTARKEVVGSTTAQIYLSDLHERRNYSRRTRSERAKS